MKTSATHPYEVDWLPRYATGTKGRVAISYAPGKKDPKPGDADGGWDRDFDADMNRIRKVLKIRDAVSLMEPFEYHVVGIPRFQARARRHGIKVRLLPITDRRLPSDLDEFSELVDDVIDVLAGGRHVLIHCRAGKGRAGMMAAAILVALGWHPSDTVRIIRNARPEALFRGKQVKFIETFRDYRDGIVELDWADDAGGD